MTQPNFVPIVETDQVRPSYRLRTPLDWRARRGWPTCTGPESARGPELGAPGPDQGYALLLAHSQFEDRLELTAGITAEDALVGGAAVAQPARRAVRPGPGGQGHRAGPGALRLPGRAPDDLVAWRAPLFQAAAHHYQQQRTIAGAVSEETPCA